MTNIHPTIATSLVQYSKVNTHTYRPISAMTPTHDHSDKHTRHYTNDELRFFDNILQNIERNHMEQGRELAAARRWLNERLFP